MSKSRIKVSQVEYLSSRITGILIEDYIRHPSAGKAATSERLTGRERVTLQLLAEGHSVKQIALRLNISYKTADANRRRIMDKLGVSSIAEMTKYAIREGLTSVEF